MNQKNLFEFLGILSNLTYTILYFYESSWCWPFAILGAIIYLYLCFAKKLFGESLLQIFYVAGAMLAWINPNFTLNLNTRTPNFHLLILFLTCSIWIFTAFLFRSKKGSYPFLDAFILTFSLAGTFYQLTFDPLNWWYFLLTNVFSIYTYWRSGLKASVILYLIYASISLAGILR
jgi:nicotinamide mononucleotide transporter